MARPARRRDPHRPRVPHARVAHDRSRHRRGRRARPRRRPRPDAAPDRRLQLAPPVGARAASPLAVPQDPPLLALAITSPSLIPLNERPAPPRRRLRPEADLLPEPRRPLEPRQPVRSGAAAGRRAGGRAPARLRLRRRDVRRDGPRRVSRDDAASTSIPGRSPSARRGSATCPACASTLTRIVGAAAPASWDVVTCMEVLEHCLEREAAPRPRRARGARAGPADCVVISVPIEIGPSVAGKQLFRAIAGLRAARRLPAPRAVLTDRDACDPILGVPIERVAFEGRGADGAYRYHGHKGFDYRDLAREIAARFTIEQRLFSPMPWLGPRSTARSGSSACHDDRSARLARQLAAVLDGADPSAPRSIATRCSTLRSAHGVGPLLAETPFGRSLTRCAARVALPKTCALAVLHAALGSNDEVRRVARSAGRTPADRALLVKGCARSRTPSIRVADLRRPYRYRPARSRRTTRQAIERVLLDNGLHADVSTSAARSFSASSISSATDRSRTSCMPSTSTGAPAAPLLLERLLPMRLLSRVGRADTARSAPHAHGPAARSTRSRSSCLHLAAHHWPDPYLLWLYDVRQIAAALSPDARQRRFVRSRNGPRVRLGRAGVLAATRHVSCFPDQPSTACWPTSPPPDPRRARAGAAETSPAGRLTICCSTCATRPGASASSSCASTWCLTPTTCEPRAETRRCRCLSAPDRRGPAAGSN